MSKEFLEWAGKVRNMDRPDDEDIAYFYSMYKQATVGDCNIDEPDDALGKAKWVAWNSRKGITKEKAQELYIKRAKELIQWT